jgi:hypothetical protein
LEVSTAIRGPDGGPGGVAAPECDPVTLRDPGSYSAITTECSTEWTVNTYTLRQTTGERTDLSYLHKDISCSDTPFTFSVVDEELETGPEPRCRSATLSVTIPAPQEQFAFDDQDTAAVEIPLQAFANPSDCAEEIIWEAPDIEGIDKNILSGPAIGGEGTALLVYSKLPRSNDDFGPITIRATLEHQVQDVEVLLFFDPEATNHPEDHPTLRSLGVSGVPPDSVPNWYYYWTQTPAMLGEAQGIIRYQPFIPAVNNPTDRVTARYEFAGDRLLISDRVYPDGCRERVDSVAHAPLGVRATGVDCFGEMVRHEFQHRVQEMEWWRSGWSGAPFVGGVVRMGRFIWSDSDGDNVPAEVEVALGGGCSDQNRFSCGRRPFADVTDAEIYAYYVGWNRWPVPGPATNVDWSKCGKQWTAGGC